MTNVIKVCVRVPEHRKPDLMKFAKQLREAEMQTAERAPGWDAKIIHEIARDHYGGLGGMFDKHGWPETGNKMMPTVQRRVKEDYGSVEAFMAKHNK
jgi:hypothetical protein